MTFYEKNSPFKKKKLKINRNLLDFKNIKHNFFLTSTNISIIPNFIKGDFK